MSFNNFGSSVKLNNIKEYNGTKNTANNTFKKQIYSDIENIDYGSYEDVDYHAIDLQEGIEIQKNKKKLETQKNKKKLETQKNKKKWYEKAGAYVATFASSAVEGFIDLGEGVVDAHIYGIAKTLQIFGVDDKWSEDIIAYDASAEMYDAIINATGIDKEIAYGPAHSAGNFVGEMVGYYALSSVPFVGQALCCIGGAGSSIEDSINRQMEEKGEVNDWAVFGESVLGAVEGYGFGKAAQGAKAGFKAVKKAGIKTVLKQTAGSVSKESLKQTAKKSGKIALKTAGQTLVDKDTYIDTASVLGDDVVHGIETGEWNFGRMAGEAAATIGGNYLGNLAGNVVGDVLSVAKSNVNLDTSKQLPSQQLPLQTNINNNCYFDVDKSKAYLNELKTQGYNDYQLAELFANYSDMCSEASTKRAFADVTYNFLLDSGYTAEDAADLLIDVYEKQRMSRGMVQVFEDANGIKYNFANNFNAANQAYTLEYVMEQVNGLPADVRKTITEVNFYDTFNPADYYWEARYKSTGGQIFTSAATAGNGQINIWSNKYVSGGVIPHEAGHCFDVDGKYSGSQEYLKAMWMDSHLTGKQSITDYGGNNPAEDFADTMAAYKNGYVQNGNEFISIDQFPNRKKFIEKNIKVEGQQYLSIYNMNELNGVARSLISERGIDQTLWAFYNYYQTGDVNKLPLPSSYQQVVAKMDMNEVAEYYNLLKGVNNK